MNKKFRETVQGVGDEALGVMGRYFKGEHVSADKITMASRMVGHALKVEHMDQIKEISDKSLALRLIKFLPKDVDRDEYIRLTNPQLKPLLLGKPE